MVTALMVLHFPHSTSCSMRRTRRNNSNSKNRLNRSNARRKSALPPLPFGPIQIRSGESVAVRARVRILRWITSKHLNCSHRRPRRLPVSSAARHDLPLQLSNHSPIFPRHHPFRYLYRCQRSRKSRADGSCHTLGRAAARQTRARGPTLKVHTRSRTRARLVPRV